MKSVLETEQDIGNTGAQGSFEMAKEDTFQSLNLVPPNKKETAVLQSLFGHQAFKILQWKIIK